MRRFWEAFGAPDELGLPDGTRLVVVTKGPDREIPAEVAALAAPGLSVVMSSEAWTDYEVPGSPFFVLVDGRAGRRIGEGVANQLARWPSWCGGRRSTPEVRATGDVVRAGGIDGPARESANDRELTDAGILPGDPSLYPASLRGHLRTGRRPDAADHPRPVRPGGLSVPTLRAHGIAARSCRASRAGSSCGVPRRRAVTPGGPVRHASPSPRRRRRLRRRCGQPDGQTTSSPSSSSTGRTAWARASSPTGRHAGELAPADFQPYVLRRGLAGQSGTQWFFTEAGRPFTLYVVLGSHARRSHLVPRVNGLLARLSVEPTLLTVGPVTPWN